MDIFDIVGPVMIGPSSSHTAGAVKIGNIARALLGERPVEAKILLHGSFAQTHSGHGTDRALVAGILGMSVDNEAIRDALSLAQERGVQVSFSDGDLAGSHPNTAEILLTGEGGKRVTVRGSSIGGGNVRIVQINGSELSFSGDYPTLIVVYDDVPGMISAITSVINRYSMNIYKINVGRDTRGGTAIVCLEMDGTNLPQSIKENIEVLPHVHQAVVLNIHEEEEKRC